MSERSFNRRHVLKLAGAGLMGSVGTGQSTTAESIDVDEAAEIEDWHDLDAVRENLDGDYVLVSDLDEDAAGYDEHVADPTSGFEPIGDGDEAFMGTFRGQNHEISGLEINRPDSEDVGLFGRNEGLIEDIEIISADITGDQFVGGLTGSNRSAAEVTSATVHNGDISAEDIVGGVVGGNLFNAEIVESTVSDSEITCENEDVGGVVGLNEGNTLVSESAVNNTDITGENLVGGIVGLNLDDAKVSLSGADDIEITGGKEVGGLIGFNENSLLSESVVHDAIIDGNENVGGLVGGNLDDAEVMQSFAAGEVSGEETVGGLLGGNFDGAITASYWDTDATEQSTGVGDGDGDVTGLTTDEIQGEAAAENMAALDFENTWDVVTDPDDYPILQVQDDRGEELPEQAGLAVQPLTIADAGPEDSFSVTVTIDETAGLAAENTEVSFTVSPSSADTTIYTETVSVGELDADAETTVTFGEDGGTLEVGPLTAGEYEATVEVAAANAETVSTSESFTVSDEPAEEPTAEDFITRDEAGNVERVEVFDAIDAFRGDQLESGELFDVIDAFREA